MELTFLGTGGAWGLPELACECRICQEMRKRGEERQRTALLLSGKSRLLIDCGPDIRDQLQRNRIDRIETLLISHEHGDHYIGLDDMMIFRRNSPRGETPPLPVCLTPETLEAVRLRFEYLEQMKIVEFKPVVPGQWFAEKEYEIFPFKTDHGIFAKGSAGFLIRVKNGDGKTVRLLYTSDCMDIPQWYPELEEPDYLVLNCYWLNEPEKNIPSLMSFQRGLEYIRRINPKKETFLVHIGDTDRIPGDPANTYPKKRKPKDPLKPPGSETPYPVPCHQAEWQKTVDQILADYNIPFKVTVACDDLKCTL